MSASYKVQWMRISFKLSLWDSGLHQESGNIPGPLPAVTREDHRPKTAAPGKAGNTCRNQAKAISAIPGATPSRDIQGEKQCSFRLAPPRTKQQMPRA